MTPETSVVTAKELVRWTAEMEDILVDLKQDHESQSLRKR